MSKSKKTHWLATRSENRPMIAKRILETLAVAMIGDGLLAFIKPRRHVRLWDAGPKAWREAIQPLEDHPEVTRWLGLAEAAAGFWLAFEQMDETRGKKK